jgi:protein required for attachment to host cells
LRGLLPKTVQSRIVAEINKDLTNIPTRDLARHLDEHLPQ